MKDYKYGVYIGRFQPFHNGHLAVVKHGLEIADNVIVVVGSAQAAPNIKNPFSFAEREKMIAASIYPERPNSVNIVGVRDYYYNENTWVSEIQAKTDQFIKDGDSVALLGAFKDASSYYLKYFPQWEFEPWHILPGGAALVNSTDIRERLLRENFMGDWEGKVPESRRDEIRELVGAMPVPAPVAHLLQQWVETPRYVELCKEWKFLDEYKAQWASAPFPPTFNTTDAIVVCSGHVLVVKRKFNPGKGLYALPGGFLKPSEKIQDGMLRELKEETGIRVDKLILESSIVGSKVFDHPQRSLRGRTITHGYYLKLKDGKLPEVRANDDASEAFWMPLMDVAKREHEFYEDHAHIVHYFLNYS